MIPYGRQDISAEDIEAVVRVLKSDFLTQGPAVSSFEREVAARCGTRYAVAISNATAGLHLGYLALGLGKGDSLWTSPITFAATANAALYCGASVDFVDIDPRTLNMSVAALSQKLHAAKKSGRLPKIVVPVHFTGEPADMAAISDLSAEFGFAILEDAAHAIGASYAGRPVGGGRNSAMAVFSFHPVKIVTTGEGGAVAVDDKELYEKMVLLRSHGITKTPSTYEHESHGGWYHEQVGLGFNYRMTDMAAALGSSQLNRLGEFVNRRHEIAARYDSLLSGLPIQLPYRNPASRSALHLYVIQVGQEQAARSRRDVYDFLFSRGIGVNVHYIPVYRHPYYQRLGFSAGYCPVAESYYERALSLPMFPGLTEAMQDRVIGALEDAFR